MTSYCYNEPTGRYQLIDRSDDGWTIKEISDAENDYVTLLFGPAHWGPANMQYREIYKIERNANLGIRVSPEFLETICSWAGKTDPTWRDYGRARAVEHSNAIYWCSTTDWDAYKS